MKSSPLLAVLAAAVLVTAACESDTAQGLGDTLDVTYAADTGSPPPPEDTGVAPDVPDVPVDVTPDIPQGCQNECSMIDERECVSATAFQRCRPMGPCLRWQGPIECVNNEICQSGQCVPSNGCNPDKLCDTPDTATCDGNDVLVCVAALECNQWTFERTCSTGFDCQNGQCVPESINDCDPLDTCSAANDCAVLTNPDSVAEEPHCQLTNCRTEWELCYGAFGTSDCKQAFQCIQECSSGACIRECLAGSSYEADLQLLDLALCMEANCPDAFENPMGNIGCFTGTCSAPLTTCCGSLTGCL